MITAESGDAGHAVYSPAVLRTYDWLVHRISNHPLWRCPTSELRRLYDRNVSDAHVDIGVAMGHYLDKAKWPVARPTITLMLALIDSGRSHEADPATWAPFVVVGKGAAQWRGRIAPAQ